MNLANFNRQLLSIAEAYTAKYNIFRPESCLYFKVSTKTFADLVVEYQAQFGGVPEVKGDEENGLYVMAFGYRVYEDPTKGYKTITGVYTEQMMVGF